MFVSPCKEVKPSEIRSLGNVPLLLKLSYYLVGGGEGGQENHGKVRIIP